MLFISHSDCGILLWQCKQFKTIDLNVSVCLLFFLSVRVYEDQLKKILCVHAKSRQSCLTVQPMDGSLPGSSVHGILQARILEWVAVPSCRGSSCRIESAFPVTPALQVDFLPLSHRGSLEDRIHHTFQFCMVFVNSLVLFNSLMSGQKSLLCPNYMGPSHQGMSNLPAWPLFTPRSATIAYSA